jgi:hypothetical protein
MVAPETDDSLLFQGIKSLGQCREFRFIYADTAYFHVVTGKIVVGSGVVIDDNVSGVEGKRTERSLLCTRTYDADGNAMRRRYQCVHDTTRFFGIGQLHGRELENMMFSLQCHWLKLEHTLLLPVFRTLYHFVITAIVLLYQFTGSKDSSLMHHASFF